MKHFKNLCVSLLTLSFLLTLSCSDDDGTTENQSGTSFMTVKLVDAPGDYEHVYVDVQDVMVKINDDSDDDSSWVSINAINTGVYDLLDLTGGVNVILADGYEIPSGTLNQIRLILGANNSVVVDGTTYPLNTPSAQQSGLKIKVNEALLPNVTYSFVLDFDADASIVMAPDLSNINLKPVIRASVEAETGLISGAINDFNDLNSQVMVVATNGVDTITTFADDAGNYILAGLPAGTYTVTLSAEASLGLGDIIFTDVEVNAGSETNLDPVTFQ